MEVDILDEGDRDDITRRIIEAVKTEEKRIKKVVEQEFRVRQLPDILTDIHGIRLALEDMVGELITVSRSKK